MLWCVVELSANVNENLPQTNCNLDSIHDSNLNRKHHSPVHSQSLSNEWKMVRVEIFQ
jgi:hypothetical protein